MSRAKRKREAGNTMVLALIILTALGTLGTITVISVQSSLKASTNDRSQAIALYAAESGAAIAIDYLRNHFDGATADLPLNTPPWDRPKAWSAFVTQQNANPQSIDAFEPTAGPTPTAKPFDDDIVAWYTTKILNNKDDFPPPLMVTNTDTTPGAPPTLPVAFPTVPPPNGYMDGKDYDGRVIVQVTGHGPQGSTAIVEVEVQWPIEQTPGVPPPTTTAPSPAGQRLTLIGWHVVNL